VAKKPDRRGEHGISCKPLRGDAGCCGDLAVNTRVHTTHYLAHEAAGAPGTRHSPRPLFFGADVDGMNSGNACRGNAAVCLMGCLIIESGFEGTARCASPRPACGERSPGEA
jgi:hypothetical protein